MIWRWHRRRLEGGILASMKKMPSFSEQGVATSWLLAQSPAKQKIALYKTVGCAGSEQRETIPRKWRNWEEWQGKCYSQHCHRLHGDLACTSSCVFPHL